VSCECCDTTCCMFSAQALFDELYTYEDLPDSVLFVESNEIFNKLNPPQNSTVGLAYYLGENGGALGSGDEHILNFEDAISWQRWSGGSIGGPGECLINAFDGPNPTPDSFRDQFANAYTVSGPISGTVTRESICVWTGENLRLTNFGFQWKVNGNNKSGFQNTPVGLYAGGFIVS
jgi:hypothetical protein